MEYPLQRLFGKKYLIWRNIIKNKIKYSKLSHIKIIDWHHAPLKKVYWHYDIPTSQSKLLITAIIVFNGDFSVLSRQISDIKAQSYRHLEVLIIADSTEQELFHQKQFESLKDSMIVSVVFCRELSNLSLLSCWNEAIQAAHGYFLWFLETEVHYTSAFLEKMLKLMEYQSVLLAFCRGGGKPNKGKTFFMSTPVFVERVLKQGLTPNVFSGVICHNPQEIPENLITYSQKFKESLSLSKWVFFLWTIRGGCIGYTTEPLLFLRNPGGQQAELEFPMILKDDMIGRHRANEYPLSVLMCCSDFMLGGGETFSIHLANELYHQGIIVTMIDFHMYHYDQNIRSLLNPAIPVVKLTNLRDLGNVISQLGGDVIHSHHGNVDEAVSLVLQKVHLKCKQFITLHGMYEAMPALDCQYLLKQVSKTCSGLIYIANKNLNPFKEYGYFPDTRLIRIGNGLPQMKVQPIQRSGLNIPDTAFVLCLASRGIREKGWREGIESVGLARQKCSKDIHLIILGDGEMRPILEPKAPSYIHFMGTVSNVRDYFSISEAGFLPSYFKGESFPLVIIEALMCGIPVIASDIGEVKEQLTDKNGELAGELIPINNWKLDIDRAAEIISSWAENYYEYQKYRQRVPSAAQKMNIQNVARKYVQVYQNKGAVDRA